MNSTVRKKERKHTMKWLFKPHRGNGDMDLEETGYPQSQKSHCMLVTVLCWFNYNVKVPEEV